MFKAARWRAEKNKIKILFRLQFRATQVPQLGWNELVVALVPLEAGKPSAKSEKATIKDGACQWENPIYETVKLMKDPRTGRIQDKIYHFFVSNGSSKTGFLGEATINFADYAETIKPLALSLPLKAANSGAVLHVTVLRIQDATEGRETEEKGDAKVISSGRTLESHLRKSNMDEDVIFSSGTTNYNVIENGSPIKGKAETNVSNDEVAHRHAESNCINRGTSGSDATSVSSLNSSSGQDTLRGLVMKEHLFTCRDAGSLFLPLNDKATPRYTLSNYINSASEIRDCRNSNAKWSELCSALDESTDGSSTNSSEDAILKKSSDVSFEKLKNEIAVLVRQAEVSELELQTLRKQVVKEGKRGNDLLREVHSLKEERDALKNECLLLKASEHHANGGRGSNRLQFENTVEEIKQEINYEKDLNADLRIQLQKTQESNAELILAVKDLEELLDQKNNEASGVPTIKRSQHLQQTEENGEGHKSVSRHKLEKNLEQAAMESLVSENVDAKVENSLRQKITDLCSELEAYKRDNEELEIQMEQLALDYEILKQENHDMSLKVEQHELQEQLKMQCECASSVAIGNELELQVENLEKELKNQVAAFEADLAVVMREKVEQEQRAVRAEAALQKMRWNNASTVERIQKEINRLSIQFTSTFELSEKLVMQANLEARELCQEKIRLEELLEKANFDIESVKICYEEKVLNLLDQIDLLQKEREQLLLGLEDKSKEVENLKKSKEDKEKTFVEEIEILQAEIQRLECEKINFLVEENEELKDEIERTKTSLEELEISVHAGIMERNSLESSQASLRETMEKMTKELNLMHHQLNLEKDSMVRSLQSELEVLKSQYNHLKNVSLEDELEKETLRKQMFRLRGDLLRKQASIVSIEKKLKEKMKQHEDEREVNNQSANIKVENYRTTPETCVSFMGDEACVPCQNGINIEPVKSNGTQPEKECVPSSQHSKIDQLLSEVAMLKERNQSMENDLKDMQERYSQLSLKFAEVEGERQELVMTLRNLKSARNN